jgi:hypothetical protein
LKTALQNFDFTGENLIHEESIELLSKFDYELQFNEHDKLACVIRENLNQSSSKATLVKMNFIKEKNYHESTEKLFGDISNEMKNKIKENINVTIIKNKYEDNIKVMQNDLKLLTEFKENFYNDVLKKMCMLLNTKKREIFELKKIIDNAGKRMERITESSNEEELIEDTKLSSKAITSLDAESSKKENKSKKQNNKQTSLDTMKKKESKLLSQKSKKKKEQKEASNDEDDNIFEFLPLNASTLEVNANDLFLDENFIRKDDKQSNEINKRNYISNIEKDSNSDVDERIDVVHDMNIEKKENLKKEKFKDEDRNNNKPLKKLKKDSEQTSSVNVKSIKHEVREKVISKKSASKTFHDEFDDEDDDDIINCI